MHMLAVRACAKMTRLYMFCQVLYMSNSLAGKHVQILSTDLAMLQTGATICSLLYQTYR